MGTYQKGPWGGGHLGTDSKGDLGWSWRAQTRGGHSGTYSKSELGQDLEGSNTRQLLGNLLKSFGGFKPEAVTKFIQNGLGAAKQEAVIPELLQRRTWSWTMLPSFF